MRRELIAFTAMMSLNAGSVAAEPTLDDYLNAPNEDAKLVQSLYLVALYDGLKWATAYNDVNGLPMMFCVPTNMVLVVEQLDQILVSEAAAGTIESEDFMPLALIRALQATFPCDEAAA